MNESIVYHRKDRKILSLITVHSDRSVRILLHDSAWLISIPSITGCINSSSSISPFVLSVGHDDYVMLFFWLMYTKRQNKVRSTNADVSIAAPLCNLFVQVVDAIRYQQYRYPCSWHVIGVVKKCQYCRYIYILLAQTINIYLVLTPGSTCRVAVKTFVNDI